MGILCHPRRKFAVSTPVALLCFITTYICSLKGMAPRFKHSAVNDTQSSLAELATMACLFRGKLSDTKVLKIELRTQGVKDVCNVHVHCTCTYFFSRVGKSLNFTYLNMGLIFSWKNLPAFLAPPTLLHLNSNL